MRGLVKRYSHVRMALQCPDKNCKWVKGMTEKEHSKICKEDLMYLPEETHFKEEHINNPKLGDTVTFIEKEAYCKTLRAVNSILISEENKLTIRDVKRILRSAI